MNKMVIFDKDLLNNIENIKFTDNNKVILKPFNDIGDDFIQSLTADFKIFVIAKNEMDFISLEFLNFVKQIKGIDCDFVINVILVYSQNENNNIITHWFEQIAKKMNVKFNVVGQHLKSDFDKQVATNFENLFNIETVQINFLTDNNNLNNNALDSRFEKLNELLNQELADDKNCVTIYTDGACSGNPGAGGWGAVLISGDRKKEISGFDENTTNNRMELTAVIEALLLLKQRCNVELYSDSAYVVNAINQNWLDNWKNNGWKGSDKKPVKNIELWQELDYLLNIHNVHFNKVKGHSDNELNNRCDELATGEIAKNTII